MLKQSPITINNRQSCHTTIGNRAHHNQSPITTMVPQPSIGQAHGVTRLVLPPQLVAAGTTTVKQCVREEQEGDGGVIMASAAEEDAAREAAAKKEQARKKAVDNRREKRRQQSRDKGVDKPGAYGKAGVKKKHKSSSD